MKDICRREVPKVAELDEKHFVACFMVEAKNRERDGRGFMMSDALLEVVDLKKHFPIKMGFFRSIISRKALFVHAVDGISFSVKKGRSLVWQGKVVVARPRLGEFC